MTESQNSGIVDTTEKVAQLNRGRVSDPAQAASSGSHKEAPGSAGGILTSTPFTAVILRIGIAGKAKICCLLNEA